MGIRGRAGRERRDFQRRVFRKEKEVLFHTVGQASRHEQTGWLRNISCAGVSFATAGGHAPRPKDEIELKLPNSVQTVVCKVVRIEVDEPEEEDSRVLIACEARGYFQKQWLHD